MSSVSSAFVVLVLSAFATVAGAQQGAKNDATVIDAKLGPCSAEFTVSDAEQKPVYNATIHVRVRYGAFGVKRMDLEVGTSPEGKARVKSLPAKAKPLLYEISKADQRTTVMQDVTSMCTATFNVTLK